MWVSHFNLFYYTLKELQWLLLNSVTSFYHIAYHYFKVSFSLCLFVFFFLITVIAAYQSSQARDWIKLSQLWPHQIFNPLHWAGGRTHTSAETQAAAVRSLTHCTIAVTLISTCLCTYLFSFSLCMNLYTAYFGQSNCARI